MILLCLFGENLQAKTPPNLSTGLTWDDWWESSTVASIEAQFNAGRRHEEAELGLTSGALGNLDLPSDFLNLDFKEQALILVNAARVARHNVYYPGFGTALGLPFEGCDRDLSEIAQLHANDMQSNDFLGHTGSNGQSSYTRITNGFPSCTEGTAENIAWNSFTGSGFISGVALAIYNFIYDDACCLWGHRILCLRQSVTTNNYNGTSRFGMVGFGRSTGANGDYFVMDFFDPISTCTYNEINFDAGQSGGSCPDDISLSGTITSGTYQADLSVTSAGLVPISNTVELVASNSVVLNPVFEVQLGSVLVIEIDDCGYIQPKIAGQPDTWEVLDPILVGGIASFRME